MKKIVAFCGVKRSGKTTAYESIKSNYPNVREITLAKKIKDVCSEIFDMDRESFDDQKLKEKKLETPFFLEESHLNAILKAYGLEENVQYTYFQNIRPHIGKVCYSRRELLQYVGTEVLRTVDSDIHCKAAIQDIPEDGLFIVTDLRFPNELKFFKNLNFEFYPFYIKREAAEVVALKDKHPSEQLVFETAKGCIEILNNSDLLDFQIRVVELIRNILSEE